MLHKSFYIFCSECPNSPWILRHFTNIRLMIIIIIINIIANMPYRTSNAFARWRRCRAQPLSQLGFLITTTAEYESYSTMVC